MDKELTIICWKWKTPSPPSTKNSKEYTHHHVNTLYNMLSRHLHIPHKLICVTDGSEGLNRDIEVVPMVKSFGNLAGCYRRLKLFDPGINGTFGNRFVSIDLDVVIVDDITPIFSVDHDFIIWGDDSRKTPYCGSLWMMNSGCRSKLWNRWSRNPKQMAATAKRKYKVGSDQSVITYFLYPEEKTWTKDDGIYNFKLDIKRPTPRRIKVGSRMTLRKRKKVMREFGRAGVLTDAEIIIRNRPDGTLPAGAKMVFFNGKFDPSDKKIQEEYPWVKENWR